MLVGVADQQAIPIRVPGQVFRCQVQRDRGRDRIPPQVQHVNVMVAVDLASHKEAAAIFVERQGHRFRPVAQGQLLQNPPLTIHRPQTALLAVAQAEIGAVPGRIGDQVLGSTRQGDGRQFLQGGCLVHA